jgi:hypothetical protein
MEAVGYIRANPKTRSTKEPGRKTQEASIRTWCEKNEVNLVAIESDEGPKDSRTGFRAALGEACRRKGALVGWSITRLFRNRTEAKSAAQELNSAGADLVSLREDVDTTQPEGKMAFRMAGALEHFDRQVEKGKAPPLAERIPFGYVTSDDGMTVEPDLLEQQIIRLMRSLRVGGLSLRDIASELNRRGVERREGQPWSSGAVSGVLNRRMVRRAKDQENRGN